MDLKPTAWDIEVRPDGVKLQFVDEQGNPVQITLSPERFQRFRFDANCVANQLVRQGAEPMWGKYPNPRLKK